MTWGAVDFTRGQFAVDRQLQKRPERDGGFVFVPPKGDKPRTIRPARLVMDMLRTRKQEQLQDRFRAGSAWDASGGTTRIY